MKFLGRAVIIFFSLLGLTNRHALHDVMVARCAGDGCGRCWCRSAGTCRFDRCTNCDMPIDENGKALFDDFYAHATTKEGHYGGWMFEFWGDEPVPCPYCNGPMPKP